MLRAPLMHKGFNKKDLGYDPCTHLMMMDPWPELLFLNQNGSLFPPDFFCPFIGLLLQHSQRGEQLDKT
jgi:hypothetical protein